MQKELIKLIVVCYNIFYKEGEVIIMYILFLFFSIILFICFVGYAYINRKKHTKATTIALVGVVIATGFLVYPLYKEIDTILIF